MRNFLSRFVKGTLLTGASLLVLASPFTKAFAGSSVDAKMAPSAQSEKAQQTQQSPRLIQGTMGRAFFESAIKKGISGTSVMEMVRAFQKKHVNFRHLENTDGFAVLMQGDRIVGAQISYKDKIVSIGDKEALQQALFAPAPENAAQASALKGDPRVPVTGATGPSAPSKAMDESVVQAPAPENLSELEAVLRHFDPSAFGAIPVHELKPEKRPSTEQKAEAHPASKNQKKAVKKSKKERAHSSRKTRRSFAEARAELTQQTPASEQDFPLHKGENFEHLLTHQAKIVSDHDVRIAISKMNGIFDMSALVREGTDVTVKQRQGVLESFSFAHPAEQNVRIVVERGVGGSYHARREIVKRHPKNFFYSRTIEHSFYADMKAAGVSGKELAQISLALGGKDDALARVPKGYPVKIVVERVFDPQGRKLSSQPVAVVLDQELYVFARYGDRLLHAYNKRGEVQGVFFPVPLEGGRPNDGWGPRRDPLNPSSFEDHKGWDWTAPEGTPLKAMADGRVVNAGFSPSFGNFIEVDCGGGFSYFYAHMRDGALYHEGDSVTQSALVGFVGRTGSRVTGSHVHIGILYKGAWINPKLLMDRPNLKGAELRAFLDGVVKIQQVIKQFEQENEIKKNFKTVLLNKKFVETFQDKTKKQAQAKAQAKDDLQEAVKAAGYGLTSPYMETAETRFHDVMAKIEAKPEPVAVVQDTQPQEDYRKAVAYLSKEMSYREKVDAFFAAHEKGLAVRFKGQRPDALIAKDVGYQNKKMISSLEMQGEDLNGAGGPTEQEALQIARDSVKRPYGRIAVVKHTHWAGKRRAAAAKLQR